MTITPYRHIAYPRSESRRGDGGAPREYKIRKGYIKERIKKQRELIVKAVRSRDRED
jgi:hypothetical protein